MLALGIAFAAFVQASASVFPLQFALGVDYRGSLSAKAQAEATERLHRLELAQAAQEAQARLQERQDQASENEVSPQVPEQAGSAPQPSLDFVSLSPDLKQRALQAYRVNPLDAGVLRTVALGIVLPAGDTQGREAARLASRASKREPLVGMWLAQDYARQEQLTEALDMLDATLRTSRSARQTAMAPLHNLLARPESHAPIGTLLARDPEWTYQFWFDFASNPVALLNAPEFMRNASITPADLDPGLRLRLYRRLRAAGLYEQLFALGNLDPETRELIQAQKAGDFQQAESTNPFAWDLVTEGTHTAFIDRRDGKMKIDLEPRSIGTAASLVMPARDDERLELSVQADLPQNDRLRIIGACREGNSIREVFAVLLEGEGRQSARRDIGNPGCPFMEVAVAFDASASDRRTTIEIDRIAFTPGGVEPTP